MRLFVLRRFEDVSGTSGTGDVAEGVEFKDGTCVLHWFGEKTSTAIYKNAQELVDIHGHEGRTALIWEENWDQLYALELARPASSQSD